MMQREAKELPTIAAVGGTGHLGQGLAYRLAQRGYPFIIGSRELEKAKTCAAELSSRSGHSIGGKTNVDACRDADIAILTVPWKHHAGVLTTIREAVQGKILVDPTVPLDPSDVTRVHLPPGGTAAMQSQKLLGDRVRVVSAFQNVAAVHLLGDAALPECDVLVSGNSRVARDIVVGLATDIGLRAWHAGPIENSAVAESLTSALLFINRFYKVRGAGIRVIGKPGKAGVQKPRGPE